MARPRNKVPSYLPHKPSGQARVRIGDRDVYLGPFGSPESKELYARLIAEHFAHGESRTIKVEADERLCIAALVITDEAFQQVENFVGLIRLREEFGAHNFKEP